MRVALPGSAPRLRTPLHTLRPVLRARPSYLLAMAPRPSSHHRAAALALLCLCSVSSSANAGALGRRLLEEAKNSTAAASASGLSSPPPFGWGVATAAYQIEGGAREGGRGPSIWDTFSKNAGDVADDFYHKYPEDIALMKKMGVNKFRMSIAWPRIVPGGSASSPVNAEGVAFYHKVIDALLEAGIEPWVTTYHWDLPQPLQDKYGGWVSPKVVDDYSRYAEVVFKEYGKKVKNWSTFNEPRTFCTLGYGTGFHAPGVKSVEAAWRCTQHVLESHAAAARHFRKEVPGGKLTMNLDGEWGEPLTGSADDRAAAQTHRDYHYGMFADPLYLGHYPESVVKHNPPGLGKISPELAKELRASMDLFALNAYTTRYVSRKDGEKSGDGLGLTNYFASENNTAGVPIGPVAESSWLFVDPAGFGKLLVYLNKRYNPGEIAVTENGVSAPGEDAKTPEEAVKDTFRVDFFKGYFAAAERAVKNDGVPLKTYFVWSFMDNLEWAMGYKERFGITYVDYKSKNLTRIPKDSFKWLSRLYGNDV